MKQTRHYNAPRQVGTCDCGKQVPLGINGTVAHDGCTICASRNPAGSHPNLTWDPFDRKIKSTEQMEAEKVARMQLHPFVRPFRSAHENAPAT